eukprot:GHVR01094668.1.p1 GENE.GHVR01094668.1~~GHVR01094668.1.p1  ORF type:complete len:254 (+),score=10.46 GHVR01094668.1:115-876(+)
MYKVHNFGIEILNYFKCIELNKNVENPSIEVNFVVEFLFMNNIITKEYINEDIHKYKLILHDVTLDRTSIRKCFDNSLVSAGKKGKINMRQAYEIIIREKITKFTNRSHILRIFKEVGLGGIIDVGYRKINWMSRNVTQTNVNSILHYFHPINRNVIIPEYENNNVVENKEDIKLLGCKGFSEMIRTLYYMKHDEILQYLPISFLSIKERSTNFSINESQHVCNYVFVNVYLYTHIIYIIIFKLNEYTISKSD